MRRSGFLIGMFVGGAVGAAIGSLFAPGRAALVGRSGQPVENPARRKSRKRARRGKSPKDEPADAIKQSI